MPARLQKEIVAAIELTINIAHSRGLRPDLESIAAIFNTTYKSKKAGPEPLGGADPDVIERCIREVTEREKEVDLNGIARVVRGSLRVGMGRSTVSRFIKVREIPFIGGKGGPNGNEGTGRGKGRFGRRPKLLPGGREASGIASEVMAVGRTTYSSPCIPSMADQNAVNVAMIYGRPRQDPAAYGPYS